MGCGLERAGGGAIEGRAARSVAWGRGLRGALERVRSEGRQSGKEVGRQRLGRPRGPRADAPLGGSGPGEVGEREGFAAGYLQDPVPASGQACGARATTAPRRPAAALQPGRERPRPSSSDRPARTLTRPAPVVLRGPSCVATGLQPRRSVVSGKERPHSVLRVLRSLRVIVGLFGKTSFQVTSSRAGPPVSLARNTLHFGLADTVTLEGLPSQEQGSHTQSQESDVVMSPCHCGVDVPEHGVHLQMRLLQRDQHLQRAGPL
ncbi:uncharacterized protein LOC130705731 [Balaenoptera acutorostrata]|uniref:Uncharacterized protein LOC130705731 n=1 Tax=Balaenoptera acutorostrata TaxID=9767 RepID=A0ABM3SKP0_BALAC|nr:uncharacterized protein LOC130705731 [Balaenoptera acutorostrata]